MNERDEIVESCIGNILILTSDARWITPALESGPLPGIYISILEMRCPGKISRERISLNELSHARAIFITNSVRGLMRVFRIDSIISNNDDELKQYKKESRNNDINSSKLNATEKSGEIITVWKSFRKPDKCKADIIYV